MICGENLIFDKNIKKTDTNNKLFTIWCFLSKFIYMYLLIE